MTAKGQTMHVRDPYPAELGVDTCPERDVILRWHTPEEDRLTAGQQSLELSAEQALVYAQEIIRVAQFVIVRNVMTS
jgi:hypothetical protein